MKRNHNFAKNLEAFRREKQMSLSEFAEEIGVPRTTLQSVLNEGNTTLDTAARISEKTGIPIDVLLSEDPLSENWGMIQRLVRGLTWFQALGPEKQEKVIYHLREIMEVLRE